MSANPLQVGIVGLGRWAKVLTRAAAKSEKLKIVVGFSRSEEKRLAFEQELGVPAVPDLKTLLSDPEIKGVVLTVPNEQHLRVAAEVAKAKKHVYTEKPIASTLEDGLEIAALEQKYGITVTVGHSARLMAGIAAILARAGWKVCVLERNSWFGGNIKTAEITEPGFVHDVFSGWHPLFVGPGSACVPRKTGLPSRALPVLGRNVEKTPPETLPRENPLPARSCARGSGA